MAASSKKEETDLFDLLKELVKNWKIMISCLILSGIVGVFIALWIRPVYKVDALIQIESKNNKSMGMMGGLGSLFATTSPAETEIELIKSRHIIGEAVEKMHLQYEATPINKVDRLLHHEGRLELSRFEIPEHLIPKKQKNIPWIIDVTDSNSFDLYDYKKHKVLSGLVGETYYFPYETDTVSIHIYRMDAKPGQKFEIIKLDRLEAIEAFKKAFDIKEKGKKNGYPGIQLPRHLPRSCHQHS